MFFLYNFSLAKISMVAEHSVDQLIPNLCCSLAKILLVAEQFCFLQNNENRCSLAKILMVAEPQNI